MMTALFLTRTLGTLCRKWQQHWAVACGAGLIFLLASGLALSLGAIVERLTTDVTTDASAAGASEVRLIQSFPQTADYRDDGRRASMGPSLADVFDGWYNDPTGATPWPTGTTSRHVVERWYDEPPTATTDTVGHDGFSAPDAPNGDAQ